ncbi:unnamed protein product, partial [Discosporangium mesarthrocarpum]
MPPTRKADGEPDTSSKRQRKEGQREVDTSDVEAEVQDIMPIKQVQDELSSLEEEEAKKIVLITKAYLALKRPLYQKRQNVIAQVPQFWLKVLLAHETTRAYILDEDQEALSFLESLTVDDVSAVAGGANAHEDDEEDEDESIGCRVTFVFGENPFFSSRELWIEYLGEADEPR